LEASLSGINVERLLAQMMRPVERALGRLISSIREDAIRQLARYSVGSGGKRLRPALLTLAYEGVSGRRADASVAAHAAAVELVHTSSIIIDDIIDGGRMRRATPPPYLKYGPFLAIVAATTLVSKAFEVFSPRPKVARLMAQTVTAMNEGESLDLLHTISDVSSDGEYFEIIEKKSASLIAACPAIGAILAEAPSKTVEALFEYGRNLGLAFQIRDDVLGLVGSEEELGKPVGSDLKERRPTLYFIHAFRHLDGEGKRRLKELIFENPLERGRPYREVIAEVISILRRAGSLEYCDKVARAYADKAKAQLSVLPQSTAKGVLLKAADYAVERLH